jgi:hypothetical protein
LPDALLLGYTRREESDIRPYLNVASSSQLTEQDKLVVMAADYELSDPTKRPECPSVNRPAVPPLFAESHTGQRILLLGWNSMAPSLLSELGRYSRGASRLVVASSVSVEQRKSELEEHGTVTRKMRVEHIETDYTRADALERIAPSDFDGIAVLASDWVHTADEADARSITAALLLQKLLDSSGPAAAGKPAPHVVLELIRPENATLLSESRYDMFITSDLISYVLTQVALRTEMNAVFEELFTAGVPEIDLLEPRAYGLGAEPVSFGALEARAASRGHTALGWRTDSEGIVLNPPRERRLTPTDMTAGCRIISLVTFER